MAVAVQRPLRGSRISSFYPVKNLPSLSSLDSAFQLQEYISLLIRLDVHDVDTIVSVPGKTSGKDKGENEGEESKGEDKEAERERRNEIAVDEACWIYEQLRRLAQDLSHPLITMLQQECTRASCPEMKAGEWLYLCVAHGNDGAMEQCCAIDYILHTLDSATALLNSPRAFPSRLQIPQSSHRHFVSLARRLGRIFAHAYFHHREAFEQAEAESSLYARFLALTSKFHLVPPEFLVIPASSEGTRGDVDTEPPRLLAAAVDPQRSLNHNQTGVPQVESGGDLGPGDWGKADENPRGLSSPARDHSPRRYGRSRTDTMVFSEAFNVAEELAKGEKKETEGTQSGQGHSAGKAELEIETITPVPVVDEVAAAADLEANHEWDTVVELDDPWADIPDATEFQPESTVHDSNVDVAEPSSHASSSDTPIPENSIAEQPAIPAPTGSTTSTSTESSASEAITENASPQQSITEEAPKVETDRTPDEIPTASTADLASEAEVSVISDAPPVEVKVHASSESSSMAADADGGEVPAPPTSNPGASPATDSIASEDTKLQTDIESSASDGSDSPVEKAADIPLEGSPEAVAESGLSS